MKLYAYMHPCIEFMYKLHYASLFHCFKNKIFDVLLLYVELNNDGVRSTGNNPR